MKLLLLTCLVASALATPLGKTKRNILPGDARHHSEQHHFHKPQTPQENEVEIARALGHDIECFPGLGVPLSVPKAAVESTPDFVIHEARKGPTSAVASDRAATATDKTPEQTQFVNENGFSLVREEPVAVVSDEIAEADVTAVKEPVGVVAQSEAPEEASSAGVAQSQTFKFVQPEVASPFEVARRPVPGVVQPQAASFVGVAQTQEAKFSHPEVASPVDVASSPVSRFVQPQAAFFAGVAQTQGARFVQPQVAPSVDVAPNPELHRSNVKTSFQEKDLAFVTKSAVAGQDGQYQTPAVSSGYVAQTLESAKPVETKYHQEKNKLEVKPTNETTKGISGAGAISSSSVVGTTTINAGTPFQNRFESSFGSAFNPGFISPVGTSPANAFRSTESQTPDFNPYDHTRYNNPQFHSGYGYNPGFGGYNGINQYYNNNQYNRPGSFAGVAQTQEAKFVQSEVLPSAYVTQNPELTRSAVEASLQGQEVALLTQSAVAGQDGRYQNPAGFNSYDHTAYNNPQYHSGYGYNPGFREYIGINQYYNDNQYDRPGSFGVVTQSQEAKFVQPQVAPSVHPAQNLQLPRPTVEPSLQQKGVTSVTKSPVAGQDGRYQNPAGFNSYDHTAYNNPQYHSGYGYNPGFREYNGINQYYNDNQYDRPGSFGVVTQSQEAKFVQPQVAPSVHPAQNLQLPRPTVEPSLQEKGVTSVTKSPVVGQDERYQNPAGFNSFDHTGYGYNPGFRGYNGINQYYNNYQHNGPDSYNQFSGHPFGSGTYPGHYNQGFGETTGLRFPVGGFPYSYFVDNNNNVPYVQNQPIQFRAGYTAPPAVVPFSTIQQTEQTSGSKASQYQEQAFKSPESLVKPTAASFKESAPVQA